jgi:selenocysteine lyase/cysteine desulfurase
MSNNRRSFIRKTFLTAGTLSMGSFFKEAVAEDVKNALIEMNTLSPIQAAQDEEIWARIQQAYTTSSTMINLNNGGVSPQPKVVQDAAIRFYQYANEAPSYYMWRILDQGREPLRAKLADLAGCSPDELAMNRNTTEAVNTVIFGMNLKAGDEVILTKYDYPNMINAWRQREKRDGIKLVWLDLELPFEKDETVVKAFTDAVTPRTKVFHITHMINWTGQIMPVKNLCDEARKRGIESLVDGAHTFAHLDFNIPDLGCDYFGTSLHKWLCAPFGTGMLYIRKEKIKDIWPLLASPENQETNIRKFENIGTRSFATEQAIGHAINFHNSIGSARKEARLHYLKSYWTKAVKDHPKVKMNTSLDKNYSCALANFSIEGLDAGPVHNKLFNPYKIHTSPIKWEKVNGPRITPHVYTTKYDLDRLVTAITNIADKA